MRLAAIFQSWNGRGERNGLKGRSESIKPYRGIFLILTSGTYESSLHLLRL